ncbi:MAG: hypothetical protein AAGA91_02070 [Pseudomonadota bacterium]
MNTRFRKSSIARQLALVCASLCLLVALALVALAAVSVRHVQIEQQEAYSSALAELVARRIATAMESGDLLSVSASLQRFVTLSGVERVLLTDVEGKALGQAGELTGKSLMDFTAPVQIDADIAGQVTLTISDDEARAARLRLVLSLLGLAILLSLAVYGASLHFSQQLGNQLVRLARVVTLEGDEGKPAPSNELDFLCRQIEALPMDLLRTRSEPDARDESYRTTAVLYLHLSSLIDYVDTLDQQALHRYTEKLHQVIYAAAGFYAGDLQVTRQFGLALFFSGDNSAGSASFRAASCAWLIKSVNHALETNMSLSMHIAMAISQSELGAGDQGDIYPGLYMQHTIDELQTVAASQPPKILLSPSACEDVDVAGRLQIHQTEVMDYAMLEEFSNPYDDLLERQLQLIHKRLTDPGAR